MSMGLPGSFRRKMEEHMGLQGMINQMIEECDFPTVTGSMIEQLKSFHQEM